MEIEKVKDVITSLCLFICSGFSCSFFLVLLYIVIISIFEEHGLIDALTGAFLTPGLICLAFASFFYTLQYIAHCKRSIMEYVEETSKISVKLVQYQYGDNNRLVEIVALVMASVLAWALSFMLLAILMDGLSHDVLVGSLRPF